MIPQQEFIFTYDQLLREFGHSFSNQLFTFWCIFIIYIVGERYKDTFSGKFKEAWDNYAFYIIFPLSLFYPVVYILYDPF